jgi:4-hydroxy 2-oxovalerate aldolase
MGQGITNVKAALDLGCTWIDSTVTGMGRGAGNAQTEYLLLEMNKRGATHDYKSVFDLANNYFEPLQKTCGWGASFPYYIGALNSVHPTYVQNIIADSAIESSAVPKLIEDIGHTEHPSKFDDDVLELVKSKIMPSLKMTKGDIVPPFLGGRDVVLVAQTESSLKYKDAIEDYFKKKVPVLMSINHPLDKLNLDFDYVFVSHNEKFREDECKYINDSFKYIAPRQLFSDSDINIAFNYGISVEEDIFKNMESYGIIPFRLTLAYAISFCIDAGVENIYLAGFSGFDQTDSRQREMHRFLAILSRENIELTSLTPTSFPLMEQSIYAI